MTSVYFKNGRALGTDEDFEGRNYDDVHRVHNVPRDFDVKGKTLEQIIAASNDQRESRRQGGSRYTNRYQFASS